MQWDGSHRGRTLGAFWHRNNGGRLEACQNNSCQLTLDPNTAYKRLLLSERNTVVTRSNTVQPYPDHPDRFDVWPQVLCRESVSGRCYWEVEWRGDGGVGIAVSYKSISRQGGGWECGFGCNDQSWRLFCYSSRYKFRYDKTDTEISGVPISSRVGVYVDHRAETLSFYSISDTMTLIHRVQTTFTEPLYYKKIATHSPLNPPQNFPWTPFPTKNGL
uniref:B30.2/SPRY domain-containing protein n=1 Tax=Astyanax mexicanus TaxID=7994 RepID=A0A3B1K658_ASTMX